MSIPHSLPGEIIDISPFAAHFESAASSTLIRENHLEVFRFVLAAGKATPEHTAAGAITIQCIEGEVELIIGEDRKILKANSLTYLSDGEPHTLKALSNASLLITILLHRK